MSRYVVKLGAQVKGKANALNEPTQQLFEVEKVFIHPDYQKIPGVTKTNSNNDVAVLKLKTPVQITDSVRPGESRPEHKVYAV